MTVDWSTTDTSDVVSPAMTWLRPAALEFDVQVMPLTPRLAVVALRGEIDAGSAARFRDAVVSAAAGGTAALVVDLSEATRIDATGLGVIVLTARRLEHGAVSLVVAHAGLARTLRACGLDRILRIHETRDEAVRVALCDDPTPSTSRRRGGPQPMPADAVRRRLTPAR
jgi:stage II sporulation protein AA (anti-sigma F factor antagonist)